jgi:hypothetical protein
MKRVKIYKNGENIAGVELDSPDAWLAEGIAANWWGLPERPELDEQGEPTGVTLPAEYTIEIEDITTEVAARQLKMMEMKRQQVGSSILADITQLNKSKYASGLLTLAQLDEMDESAVFQKIERNLWRGALPTTKQLIMANNAILLGYYTQSEIDGIVSKINSELGV